MNPLASQWQSLVQRNLQHWEVPVRNVMRTHYCIICRALGNCWGFASTWEKTTPENRETGASGFIWCVFPAGLLLLLRLTYLSSHRLCCSRILRHPPRLLSLHSACLYSWVSGGPRPRAGVCGAGCELLTAARGCLCLSESPCKVLQAKARAHVGTAQAPAAWLSERTASCVSRCTLTSLDCSSHLILLQLPVPPFLFF